MIQLTVWGGAGEHGRSCYLIEHEGKRILLDCGVKKEGHGEYPLLSESIIPKLDAVFLSHAHEDHSMAIPLLYHMGYKGKVWTTRATVKQLSGYISSWHKYVKEQQADLPYDPADVEAIQFTYLEDAASASQWFTAAPSIQVCWGRSGHLIGSVWLMFELGRERLFYSGDYTMESELLRVDSPTYVGETDIEVNSELHLSIVDAAYGSDPEEQITKLEQIAAVLGGIIGRGGRVLLPVPLYGRGQDLMVWVREQFPEVPILAEPELVNGLRQMLEWQDWLKPGAVERIQWLLDDSGLIVLDQQEQRDQAVTAESPGVLFIRDGMMQSERAQWYYRKLKEGEYNGIILTGHLARGSFGQRLLQSDAASSCSLQVQAIRYKVHQGLPDVRRLLQQIRSRQTVLVHAGKIATDALCQQLADEGFTGLHAIVPGETISS